MSFPWLTVIGALPLVGSAVVLAVPRSLAHRTRELALGFSLASLVLVIIMALQFKRDSSTQFQFAEVHQWIPQFGVSYALGVDGIGLVLIALAWLRYWHEQVPEVAPVGSVLTRAARQDLYQDEINEALLMRPGEYLTRSLVFVDGKGVDGAVGGLAALVGGVSSRMRRLQNGFVRSYALTMLAGVVVVLGALAVAR